MYTGASVFFISGHHETKFVSPSNALTGRSLKPFGCFALTDGQRHRDCSLIWWFETRTSLRLNPPDAGGGQEHQ
jgi:hypothetical protein